MHWSLRGPREEGPLEGGTGVCAGHLAMGRYRRKGSLDHAPEGEGDRCDGPKRVGIPRRNQSVERIPEGRPKVRDAPLAEGPIELLGAHDLPMECRRIGRDHLEVRRYRLGGRWDLPHPQW